MTIDKAYTTFPIADFEGYLKWLKMGNLAGAGKVTS